MSIAIVTDSTSDLTPEHLASLGVTSVPLYVLLGGQLYQDGVQLGARQLVEQVRAGNAMPSTSQPSPAEFAQAYARALEQADEVLSLLIAEAEAAGAALLVATHDPVRADRLGLTAVQAIGDGRGESRIERWLP